MIYLYVYLAVTICVFIGMNVFDAYEQGSKIIKLDDVFPLLFMAALWPICLAAGLLFVPLIWGPRNLGYWLIQLRKQRKAKQKDKLDLTNPTYRDPIKCKACDQVYVDK